MVFILYNYLNLLFNKFTSNCNCRVRKVCSSHERAYPVGQPSHRLFSRHLESLSHCHPLVEFFELILKSYEHAPKIILLLDNAKYFKAKIVNKWLKKHPKLELEFLPPYSPNLNLIERFWRFVKKKLVKNRYYEKYKTFRAEVFQLLNHTDKYIDEFRSLMVEKFEIVKNKQNLCLLKPKLE